MGVANQVKIAVVEMIWQYISKRRMERVDDGDAVLLDKAESCAIAKPFAVATATERETVSRFGPSLEAPHTR